MDYHDVLGAVYTDPALKSALEVLDKQPKKDSSSVRTAAEATLLNDARAALQQLAPFEVSLSRLQTGVKAAESVYTELITLLNTSAEQMEGYKQAASEIESKRANETAKLDLLRAYSKSCRLQPQDIQILSAGNSELDNSFFESLDRVTNLQMEPAMLLLGEAPTIGERLMLETTKLLDNAYLRVETAARICLKDKRPAAARPLLKRLAARPLLLKQVLADENADQRADLVKRFEQFAVAEQVSARVAPQRYLGSVLAFLHASVVNERENVSLLFEEGGNNQQETEPELGQGVYQGSGLGQGSEVNILSNGGSIVDDLVDETVSALENPLRQHVTAAIVAQVSLPVVDEMQDVLQLYASMLQKHRLPAISRLLEQLDSALERQFSHCLAFVHGWDSAVDVAYAVLVQNDEGVAPSDEKAASKINLILRPQLDKALAQKSDNVSVLNTVDLAVMRLAGFAPAQPFLDELQDLSTKHEQEFANELARELDQDSGVTETVEKRLPYDQFTQRFQRFLETASARLQNRVDQLTSPSVGAKVSELAVDAFITKYSMLPQSDDIPDSETLRSLL